MPGPAPERLLFNKPRHSARETLSSQSCSTHSPSLGPFEVQVLLHGEHVPRKSCKRPGCIHWSGPQAERKYKCLTSSNKDATRNKCIASSNKCLTSSNKDATSSNKDATRNKCIASSTDESLSISQGTKGIELGAHQTWVPAFPPPVHPCQPLPNAHVHHAEKWWVRPTGGCFSRKYLNNGLQCTLRLGKG